MDNEPLVLIFDVGTQSTRAFLFNKRGEVVASSKVETEPFFSNRIGYAEKKTIEYWEALCEASLQLKNSCGRLWDDVIAMGVTTIRNTYALLDKNMQPVRHTITWLDQRLAGEKQHFDIIHKAIYGMVGMSEVVLKQRRMSPSTWLKENEPENWKKTHKFVMISAYINYKLTNKLVDSTASQAGRLPYNYKKHAWMKKYELNHTVFNVENEKLCDLIEPGSITGHITAEAAKATGIKEGMRVITTGADKACETLGVGCLKDDIASISFGTTATIELMSEKYFEPQKFMPAYNSVVGRYFNPEMQVFRGYWMVTWFKEQFASNEMAQAKELGIKPERLLDMTLRSIPVGSDGLIVQPYWAPGLKIPEAKGTIIGFNDIHTREHLYRAIIEGIGYELYGGLKGMEKRGHLKINTLSASGGGAQSDAVCQITADMFGLPVYRVQTYETSGLGAAIIVFNAMKEFKDVYEGVESMVHFKDKFEPQMHNHEKYKSIYDQVYSKLYKQVQPLYSLLYKIVH